MNSHPVKPTQTKETSPLCVHFQRTLLIWKLLIFCVGKRTDSN